MRLIKLITAFKFTEYERNAITLGPNVRLDGANRQLELVKTGIGYSTAPNLYAKTRVVRPSTMKRVIGFEANVANVVVDGTQLTDVKYRLSGDGTEELYWDGAAWASAASGQWSSEADVANNIDTFPMLKRGIQVVINLSTTNARYTPSVVGVKVLWESDIVFQEDYIVRSFLAEMEEQLRPIGEVAYKSPPSGASNVVVNPETQYVVSSIDSAFDATVDPNCLDNIAGAWNAGTKTLALTSVVPAGNQIVVRFAYVPLVAMTTGQEYNELARVPAVEVGDVVFENRRDIIEGDTVFNKSTGQGWRLKGGQQVDIILPFKVIANREKDAQRVSDEIERFLSRTTLLRSRGLDEPFTLLATKPYGQSFTPNQKGLHGARLGAKIVGALFYWSEAERVYMATNPIQWGDGGNLGT